VVARDAARPEQRAEVLGAEDVALDLVLEILLPVETDGPGDVSLLAERRDLLKFDCVYGISSRYKSP
jgi:hypothetical protein